MENIGKRIKELRKKNDLTQEKLADYLNVSFQAVSKWEKGVNAPDLALIVPLAKLLNTTTDDLLGLAGKEARLAHRQRFERQWGDAGEDYPRKIALAEEMVRLYPEEMFYWYMLGEAEYQLGIRLKVEQNRQAEAPEVLERALKHSLMVVEDAPEFPGRDLVLERVVYILGSLGRREEGVPYARMIVQIPVRDRALRLCLSREELEEHTQMMRYDALQNMINELQPLLPRHLWAAEATIYLIEHMVGEGDPLLLHYHLYEAWGACARHHARDGLFDLAMDDLRKCFHHAREDDRLSSANAAHTFTGPLMNRVTLRSRRNSFNRAHYLPTQVADPCFDPMREREDFRALLAEAEAIPAQKEES